MGFSRKSDRLTAAQKSVIKRGFAGGLTESQISYYSDPAFSPEQMEEIRLGLLDGLKPSEVRVFADPLVSVDEMRRIRRIYLLTDEIDQGMKQLSNMIDKAEQRSKATSHHHPFIQKPGR